jgi:hypothetical protein
VGNASQLVITTIVQGKLGSKTKAVGCGDLTQPARDSFSYFQYRKMTIEEIIICFNRDKEGDHKRDSANSIMSDISSESGTSGTETGATAAIEHDAAVSTVAGARLREMDHDELILLVHRLNEEKHKLLKRDRSVKTVRQKPKKVAKKITNHKQLDDDSILPVHHMCTFKSFVQSRVYNRFKYLDLKIIQEYNMVEGVAKTAGIKGDVVMEKYKLSMEIAMAKKIESCRNTTVKYLHKTHDKYRMEGFKGELYLNCNMGLLCAVCF